MKNDNDDRIYEKKMAYRGIAGIVDTVIRGEKESVASKFFQLNLRVHLCVYVPVCVCNVSSCYIIIDPSFEQSAIQLVYAKLKERVNSNQQNIFILLIVLLLLGFLYFFFYYTI